MNDGYVKRLTDSGYVAQIEQSTRHNFSGGPGLRLVVVKDGKRVWEKDQNHDGKGGVGLPKGLE
jgi:hypothetical protein